MSSITNYSMIYSLNQNNTHLPQYHPTPPAGPIGGQSLLSGTTSPYNSITLSSHIQYNQPQQQYLYNSSLQHKSELLQPFAGTKVLLQQYHQQQPHHINHSNNNSNTIYQPLLPPPLQSTIQISNNFGLQPQPISTSNRSLSHTNDNNKSPITRTIHTTQQSPQIYTQQDNDIINNNTRASITDLLTAAFAEPTTSSPATSNNIFHTINNTSATHNRARTPKHEYTVTTSTTNKLYNKSMKHSKIHPRSRSVSVPNNISTNNINDIDNEANQFSHQTNSAHSTPRESHKQRKPRRHQQTIGQSDTNNINQIKIESIQSPVNVCSVQSPPDTTISPTAVNNDAVSTTVQKSMKPSRNKSRGWTYVTDESSSSNTDVDTDNISSRSIRQRVNMNTNSVKRKRTISCDQNDTAIICDTEYNTKSNGNDDISAVQPFHPSTDAIVVLSTQPATTININDKHNSIHITIESINAYTADQRRLHDEELNKQYIAQHWQELVGVTATRRASKPHTTTNINNYDRRRASITNHIRNDPTHTISNVQAKLERQLAAEQLHRASVSSNSTPSSPNSITDAQQNNDSVNNDTVMDIALQPIDDDNNNNHTTENTDDTSTNEFSDTSVFAATNTAKRKKSKRSELCKLAEDTYVRGVLFNQLPWALKKKQLLNNTLNSNITDSDKSNRTSITSTTSAMVLTGLEAPPVSSSDEDTDIHQKIQKPRNKRKSSNQANKQTNSNNNMTHNEKIINKDNQSNAYSNHVDADGIDPPHSTKQPSAELTQRKRSRSSTNNSKFVDDVPDNEVRNEKTKRRSTKNDSQFDNIPSNIPHRSTVKYHKSIDTDATANHTNEINKSIDISNSRPVTSDNKSLSVNAKDSPRTTRSSSTSPNHLSSNHNHITIDTPKSITPNNKTNQNKSIKLKTPMQSAPPINLSSGDILSPDRQSYLHPPGIYRIPSFIPGYANIDLADCYTLDCINIINAWNQLITEYKPKIRRLQLIDCSECDRCDAQERIASMLYKLHDVQNNPELCGKLPHVFRPNAIKWAIENRVVEKSSESGSDSDSSDTDNQPLFNGRVSTPRKQAILQLHNVNNTINTISPRSTRAK